MNFHSSFHRFTVFGAGCGVSHLHTLCVLLPTAQAEKGQDKGDDDADAGNT